MTTVKGISQNVTPQTPTAHAPRSKEKFSQALLDKIAEDTKMVKGVFRVFGVDGNPMAGAMEKITFRKYPEELVPSFSKYMLDGETYEVPLYIARFLNGIDACAHKLNGKIHSCSFPVHGWLTTRDGGLKEGQLGVAANGMFGVPMEMSSPQRYKKRFGFEALIFEAAVV